MPVISNCLTEQPPSLKECGEKVMSKSKCQKLKMHRKLRFRLSIFVSINFLAAIIWLADTASASDYFCDPPCPLNAHCVEHKKHCECNSGYYQNISEQNGLPLCRPLCVEDCVPPLICDGPNICNCPQGYLYKHLECEPECSLGCQNGYCKAPEVCTCYEGFILTHTNVCVEDLNKSTVKLSVVPLKRNGNEDEPRSRTYEEEMDVSVEVSSERVHRPFVKLWNNIAETTTEYAWDVSDAELEDDNGITTIVPSAGDVAIKLVTDSEKICSNGSNFEDGACGPYTLCDNSGRCVCIPGYSRQQSINGSRMTCVSETETKERFLMIPSDDQESSCLRGLYTLVGMACVTGALLSVLVYIYRYRQ